jgi:hypothetical protein
MVGMPVLPIIDLLILMGWTSLALGAVLKMVYLSTSYRPRLLGLTPFDFLIVAGVFLIFALSLAARTWVKLHEPRLLAALRRTRDERERNGAAANGETPKTYEHAQADRPDPFGEAVGR